MLYRKSSGSESKLSYLGHVLMENRNGLVVDTRLTRATGTAEREAALDMAARIPGSTRRVTADAESGASYGLRPTAAFRASMMCATRIAP